MAPLLRTLSCVGFGHRLPCLPPLRPFALFPCRSFPSSWSPPLKGGGNFPRSSVLSVTFYPLRSTCPIPPLLSPLINNSLTLSRSTPLRPRSFLHQRPIALVTPVTSTSHTLCSNAYSCL